MVRRTKRLGQKKYHQIGSTNRYIDGGLLARLPGKRIVKHGKRKPTVYYEYRKNRSDISRRKRPYL
jgi:hypothetical protein